MQMITNLGRGGSVLDAQNGSSASADSNDALYLPWPGPNGGSYLERPSGTSNYAQYTITAGNVVTSDLDVRAHFKRAAGAEGWPVGRLIGSNRHLALQMTNTRFLRLFWSPNGTLASQVSRISTVAVTAATDEVYWIRATLDVDNGAGGHTVEFYTSTDGETWTALGTAVTTAGTTSIFDASSGNQPMYLGTYSPGITVGTTELYRVQLFRGIAGTKVVDIDFRDMTSGSGDFTSSTGQAVTFVRAASGDKAVAVVTPVWLFRTDDFWKISDNDLLNFDEGADFTALIAYRKWADNSETPFIFKAGNVSASATGYSLRKDASGNAIASISDGSVSASVSTTDVALGSVGVAVIRRDAGGDLEVLTASNSAIVTSASVTDLTTSTDFYIGAYGDLSTFADVEVMATAVFDRKLSNDEIATITTYYQNRWL